MNFREGKIGRQEGICLATIAMCVGGLFTLDPQFTYSNGNASYLTLVIAAVLSLLVFMLASVCMKRMEYVNLSGMLEDTCGKLGGGVLTIMLLIGFVFASYDPLARFVQVMHGLFFSGVDYRQIILYMMPSVIIIAWLGLETLGRTAKCFFILLFAVTIATVLAASGEYESYRLYPLIGGSVKNAASLSLSETSAFLPAFAALLICSKGLNGNKNMLSVGLYAGIIAAAICAVIQLLLGMVFTYRDLQKLVMPLCRINHISADEASMLRLDKIAQVFWMNGSMLSGAFYIYAGASLFSRSFGIRDIRPVIAPVGMFTVILILMEFDGVFLQNEWVLNLWKALGGALFAVPLIIPSLISLFKRSEGVENGYENKA